jgi:hypothetical protein
MIYTDKIHLVADSINELHSFAENIGLKRYYFEGVHKGHPHYDLTNKDIIEKVLTYNVIIISTRELLQISKKLI